MTDIKAVIAYLHAVRDIHASGAGGPEGSYWTALTNLLNATDNVLKPKV